MMPLWISATRRLRVDHRMGVAFRSARRASPSACGRARSAPRAVRRASFSTSRSSLPSALTVSSSPSLHDHHARRVVAAILEPPQPVHQKRHHLALTRRIRRFRTCSATLQSRAKRREKAAYQEPQSCIPLRLRGAQALVGRMEESSVTAGSAAGKKRLAHLRVHPRRTHLRVHEDGESPVVLLRINFEDNLSIDELLELCGAGFTHALSNKHVLPDLALSTR